MTGRSREPGSSEELSGLKGTTGPMYESQQICIILSDQINFSS